MSGLRWLAICYGGLSLGVLLLIKFKQDVTDNSSFCFSGLDISLLSQEEQSSV